MDPEGKRTDGGRAEHGDELLPQAEGAEVGNDDDTDLPQHDLVGEELRER